VFYYYYYISVYNTISTVLTNLLVNYVVACFGRIAAIIRPT